MNIPQDIRRIVGCNKRHDLALRFAAGCDRCIQKILGYLLEHWPGFVVTRREARRESQLMELLGDARELLRLAVRKTVNHRRLVEAVTEFDERQKGI